MYVSCPLALFGTVRYDDALRALRHIFTRSVFLLPDQLFKSREDWLSRWQLVSRDMTDLIILTDGAGYIGRGGFAEIRTALVRGATIHLLTRDNRLVPFSRLSLSAPNESDWCRYCRVTVRTDGEAA